MGARQMLTLLCLPLPSFSSGLCHVNQNHPGTLHYLDGARQSRARSVLYQNLLPATAEGCVCVDREGCQEEFGGLAASGHKDRTRSLWKGLKLCEAHGTHGH